MAKAARESEVSLDVRCATKSAKIVYIQRRGTFCSVESNALKHFIADSDIWVQVDIRSFILGVNLGIRETRCKNERKAREQTCIATECIRNRSK